MPSENTLTLHATHRILNWLEPKTEQTVVRSPSRFDEGNNDEGGYDVKHELARAVHLQYKAPKGFRKQSITLATGENINPVCFTKFNIYLKQHETILLRNEAIEHGYYVFPNVHSANTLPNILQHTLFVNAYAIRLNTSKLYLPYPFDGHLYAKLNNGYYYRINCGIRDSSEFFQFLSNRDYGFGVREDGGYSTAYIRRVARILMTKHLFDMGYTGPSSIRLDGGEAPENEFRWEYARSLARFILQQRNQFRDEFGRLPGENLLDREHEGELLVPSESQIVNRLRGRYEDRDPSLTGIRQSQQLVSEFGDRKFNIPLESIPSSETAELITDTINQIVEP